MNTPLHILIAFILLTIVGTLTHELSHYAAAKYYGQRASLHYGRVVHVDTSLAHFIHDLNAKYNSVANAPMELQADLKELQSAYLQSSFIITLVGPLQTMLTGVLGLVLLLIKDTRNKKQLDSWDWFAILLSLFWSRQVFNLCSGLTSYLFFDRNNIFGGDEARLANYLELPSGTFSLLFAVVGFVVCLYIVFVVVPQNIRWMFFSFGILGSGLGFILWFYLVGPLLLP